MGVVGADGRITSSNPDLAGDTDGGYEQSGQLKKDLSGGQQMMKWVLVGLSVLYLIFGCVLCAVGSYATTGTASQLAGQTLPEGLIAVGVFLMFTAILGIVSAVREWRIGLGIFFVLMLIWSIILIAVGIAVYVEKNQITSLLASGWEYADFGLQNGIQQNWLCCGRYGESDRYAPGTYGYTQSGGTGLTYPVGPGIEICAEPVTGSTNEYGCVTALSGTLQSNFNTAGSCGIAFAVIMFIGLAFTCFLMRGIQSKGYSLAIEKNRLKTEKELADRRKRGKGGFKQPDTVL